MDFSPNLKKNSNAVYKFLSSLVERVNHTKTTKMTVTMRFSDFNMLVITENLHRFSCPYF